MSTDPPRVALLLLLAVAVGMFGCRQGTDDQRDASRIVLGAAEAAESASQEEESQEVEAQPASLLKVLGAAADGYRTGEPIWILADPAPPHEIAGVFSSREEATRHPSYQDPFQVYGPFETPVEIGLPEPFILSFGCWHDRWTRWECPKRQDLTALSLNEVESITVTFTPTEGEAVVHRLSPDSVDAVFFTLSAVDHFVLPYYTGLYGSSYADGLRQELVQALAGGVEER